MMGLAGVGLWDSQVQAVAPIAGAAGGPPRWPFRAAQATPPQAARMTTRRMIVSRVSINN